MNMLLSIRQHCWNNPQRAVRLMMIRGIWHLLQSGEHQVFLEENETQVRLKWDVLIVIKLAVMLFIVARLSVIATGDKTCLSNRENPTSAFIINIPIITEGDRRIRPAWSVIEEAKKRYWRKLNLEIVEWTPTWIVARPCTFSSGWSNSAIWKEWPPLQSSWWIAR